MSGKYRAVSPSSSSARNVSVGRSRRASKLDRTYDDRLSRRISDELWGSKSAELEAELQRVRAEMERHERASHEYEATGLQILELAQNAYSLHVTENPPERARLVKTLLSNCTFDRGTLCPTYRKPFDLFAKGSDTEGIGSPPWTISAPWLVTGGMLKEGSETVQLRLIGSPT